MPGKRPTMVKVSAEAIIFDVALISLQYSVAD